MDLQNVSFIVNFLFIKQPIENNKNEFSLQMDSLYHTNRTMIWILQQQKQMLSLVLPTPSSSDQ